MRARGAVPREGVAEPSLYSNSGRRKPLSLRPPRQM